MKAAVYREYGNPDVVHIEEVATPTAGVGQVLIRVRTTTVASGDWRMRSAEIPDSFKLIAPFIFGKKPKQQVLGTELAGVVEAVGEGVTRWKAGDAVFAYPGAKLGAHAEYIAVPQERVAAKPNNLSFEEAAALSFGGSTALSFIEKGGGIRRGDRVLVIGASGAVGSAMVQLSKHYGATVTGVCSSANVELVKSIGADHVIDYTEEDFTTQGARYHVVMDTTGTVPVPTCERVLENGGRIMSVSGGLADMLRPLLPWGPKVVAGPANEDPAHLALLAELAESGVYKPLIDETFTFDRIVDAHRRVDSGRKRGNVVVRLD